jgi:MFS family permease
VRKALLAAAVTSDSYGRAFGFERMMDTLGAIIGPISALFLLQLFAHHYRPVFLCTLAPGLVAAGLIGLCVREAKRMPVPHISFGQRLRVLSLPYRQFLCAAGLFGAGDFAHTLLILLATQKLAPALGLARAATVAVSLYLLHNIFYAGFCLLAGWLADRMRKNLLLALGYALAGVMAVAIFLLPASIWGFAVIFALGGIQVGIGETIEDAFCAELIAPAHHGLAFGVLSTVNGIGDFLSSIVVGLLWTACGTTVAFGYSAILFFAGAALMLRLPKSSDFPSASAKY